MRCTNCSNLELQLQRRLKHRNIVKVRSFVLLASSDSHAPMQIIDSFDVEDGIGVALQLAPNQVRQVIAYCALVAHDLT